MSRGASTHHRHESSLTHEVVSQKLQTVSNQLSQEHQEVVKFVNWKVECTEIHFLPIKDFFQIPFTLEFCFLISVLHCPSFLKALGVCESLEQKMIEENKEKGDIN